MKLTDFNTLAAAQAHEVVTDTKQVGSGQARGYFVNTNNLWGRLRAIQAITSDPFYAVADTIIATALDANSYFGMDPTKPDGIANRGVLALLVSQGVLTQPEHDGFIAKTLSVEKPFLNATQIEFDEAVADALLYIDTPEVKTHYGVLDSVQDKHVKSANESIRISAMLDVVNTVDTVIQVYVHTDDFDQNIYAKNERSVGSITIPAGQLSGALTLVGKSKSLSRWTQFSSVANVSGVYNLLVKSA